MTPRPPEATWANAELYHVRLFETRWPVCGTHLMWAVVGHKWVRLCKPVANTKFRMRRSEWNALAVCELFETRKARLNEPANLQRMQTETC